MSENENVIAAIEKVEHPAISLSLTDLGIVRDIQVDNREVILTFAFPFPNIPIADRLIGSVDQAVNTLGYELKYIVRVMKEDKKNQGRQKMPSAMHTHLPTPFNRKNDEAYFCFCSQRKPDF